MPDEVKERRMYEKNQPVSRQTIANYTQKLVNREWICRDTSNYIYYFAYKGMQKLTTREVYSQAWKEYWRDKENGFDSILAIKKMQLNYGGVARKQATPEANVFYLDKIQELCNLIQESIEKEIEN